MAIVIGKVVAWLTNIQGSGSTAAPGLVALKIEPNLVAKLSSQLKKNIVITGTNGKTTSSRLIAAILKQAGIKIIHNRAGSNLLRGMASTLINKAALTGRLPSDCWGLWESDEAVFPEACRQIRPQLVLVNNLFRDQLDRYGEIDTVAKGWRQALNQLPKDSIVVLNADDATVASLGKNLANKVYYFGLNDRKLAGAKPDHASDATVCPYCFSSLKYEACFSGHMGIYRCPNHGQIQPQKDFAINNAGKYKKFSAKLPGNYNLYNLAAAISLASVLKIDPSLISAGIDNFRPAFGRVEKIKFKNKAIKILLVKNPTGFNEVIHTLTSNSHATVCGSYSALIAINDLIADGKDISWLWDVNFEKLAPKMERVIVSGTRAYDMALRLKYSNAAMKQSNNETMIEPDLQKAVVQLLNLNSQTLYILPTYTAMLEIRKILNRMGLVHSSWED